MILIDNLKLCIVTPPKTGSTSLHYTLCRPPYTGMCVIGPQYDDDTRVEKHTHHLPWRVTAKDYRVVIVTRNPQDRALSLWNHARSYAPNSYVESFNEFLEQKLITGRYKFGSPLSKVYGAIQYDAIVRLEKLERDLKALGVPLVTKVRKMNENPGELPPIDVELMRRWKRLERQLTLKSGEPVDEDDPQGPVDEFAVNAEEPPA